MLPWLGETAPARISTCWIGSELESWFTPADDFFVVSHFDRAGHQGGGLEAEASAAWSAGRRRWRSPTSRAGRVARWTSPSSARATHGFPEFYGGVGNARWAGAALAPILKEAGVRKEGIEVVFWGADIHEDATIRDNQGVLRTGSIGDRRPRPRRSSPAGST